MKRMYYGYTPKFHTDSEDLIKKLITPLNLMLFISVFALMSLIFGIKISFVISTFMLFSFCIYSTVENNKLNSFDLPDNEDIKDAHSLSNISYIEAKDNGYSNIFEDLNEINSSTAEYSLIR